MTYYVQNVIMRDMDSFYLTYNVGRVVWVRFNARWIEGRIAANDGRSVTAKVGPFECAVHSSVVRRDLRLSKPKGA